MISLRVLLSRAFEYLRSPSRDRALTDEVQAHLDLLTDEYVAKGMTPADARLAARRAFGGVDQVKATCRDQRGLPVLDALVQDTRFGIRLLMRDRGFALTAILVLGLGIGVNNMFFTLVYGFTMRGLPLSQPHRVMHISTFDDRMTERPISWPDFENLREQQSTFARLAAFASAPVTVGDEGRSPERFEATYLSANAFGLLDIAPLAGRLFSDDDDRSGAEPVVILGAAVWESRYGRNTSLLGRAILVNGAPATVVGVIPDRSGFPTTATVWLPLAQMPGLLEQPRGMGTLRGIGRLRDGVPEDAARADIDSIVTRLAPTFPDSSRKARARVIPINQRILGRLEGAWLAFISAGCIIVLISCANVANLMLARAMHRSHEIAIRTSLGASRGRLVRQLLVEGLLLAVCGGAVGLAVSVVGVRIFQSAIPQNTLPYWNALTMDARVLGVLAAVSLGTVLVFGLIPAIQASRSDVNVALKDGGRSSVGRRGARAWTTAFLALQLALAVILMAQVGLATLQLRSTVVTDRAITTTEVLTAAITLPSARYATSGERTALYRQVDERLRSTAGVSSVALASNLPVSGASERRLEIAGQQPKQGTQPTVWVVDVSPSYFETLRLPVVRGRPFSTLEDGLGPSNVIVNERFVEMFFDGEEPLGQRVALNAPTQAAAAPRWHTIVGVAPTIRQRAVRDSVPVAYFPINATAPATFFLMVRSQVDAAVLAPLLRAELQAIDSNVPLYRMNTLAKAIEDQEWNSRVSAGLGLFLTFICVALATVGLYAVTAQRVTLRTQEIGLRMALGASRAGVTTLVLRSICMPLVLGFLAGIAGALAWDRAFSSGTTGAIAADPESLLIIVAMLALVCLVACFAPVRRATQLDPMAALRDQ